MFQVGQLKSSEIVVSCKWYCLEYVKMWNIDNSFFKWFELLGEWLLFNANSEIFSAISWQEQVKFNEMMMMSTLY
jgi:hypothetical protein